MDIKILVAAHKKYWMPKDSVYLPIQVGDALHPALGYIPDNTGDNISAKNPNYCELTASSVLRPYGLFKGCRKEEERHIFQGGLRKSADKI